MTPDLQSPEFRLPDLDDPRQHFEYNTFEKRSAVDLE